MALGIVLLEGPRGVQFLMSEVPLWRKSCVYGAHEWAWDHACVRGDDCLVGNNRHVHGGAPLRRDLPRNYA